MAEPIQQVIGTGVNFGINRGLGALGNRLPMPNFYNPNSANHFGDSEAGQMLHGNTRAIRRFGTRKGLGLLGGALLSPLGPLGAMAGNMLGNWAGGKISDHFDAPNRTNATVNVGAINTDGSGNNASINPFTGQVTYSNSMPNFSSYGPYQAGYQSPNGNTDTGPVMPSFGDYSDQYTGGDGMQDGGPSVGGYNFSGPGFPGGLNGNSLGYSSAGGSYGAGVAFGGGGMHSYQVNSGSLSPSNYSGIGGIAHGRGKENGVNPN